MYNFQVALNQILILILLFEVNFARTKIYPPSWRKRDIWNGGIKPQECQPGWTLRPASCDCYKFTEIQGVSSAADTAARRRTLSPNMIANNKVFGGGNPIVGVYDYKKGEGIDLYDDSKLVKADWQSARTLCAAQAPGADLLSVRNDDERQFLEEIFCPFRYVCHNSWLRPEITPANNGFGVKGRRSFSGTSARKAIRNKSYQAPSCFTMFMTAYGTIQARIRSCMEEHAFVCRYTMNDCSIFRPSNVFPSSFDQSVLTSPNPLAIGPPVVINQNAAKSAETQIGPSTMSIGQATGTQSDANINGQGVATDFSSQITIAPASLPHNQGSNNFTSGMGRAAFIDSPLSSAGDAMATSTARNYYNSTPTVVTSVTSVPGSLEVKIENGEIVIPDGKGGKIHIDPMRAAKKGGDVSLVVKKGKDGKLDLLGVHDDDNTVSPRSVPMATDGQSRNAIVPDEVPNKVSGEGSQKKVNLEYYPNAKLVPTASTFQNGNGNIGAANNQVASTGPMSSTSSLDIRGNARINGANDDNSDADKMKQIQAFLIGLGNQVNRMSSVSETNLPSGKSIDQNHNGNHDISQVGTNQLVDPYIPSYSRFSNVKGMNNNAPRSFLGPDQDIEYIIE